MPDINPAALQQRPSISITTPTTAPKVSSASALKLNAKTAASAAPPRIDLEPIYTKLKAAIPKDQWAQYKRATALLVLGKINHSEFRNATKDVFENPTPDKVKMNLHNKLIIAIHSNLRREPPAEPGVASWVTQNDKPVAAPAPKASANDTEKARFKINVMALPSRDRRRLKDLANNEFDLTQDFEAVFSSSYRKKMRPNPEVTSSTTGAADFNKMNVDLEIRKKYQYQLSAEANEFPTTETIEQRMLPYCYENDLTSGHHPDAPKFVSAATETFIREVLSKVFAYVYTNGPGDTGSVGFGAGPKWVQTRRYRKRLRLEEQQWAAGELARDKMGLLPVEAKAALKRGPLTLGDVRLVADLANTGIQNYPAIATSLQMNMREEEYAHYDEYTVFDGSTNTFVYGSAADSTAADVGHRAKLPAQPNGVPHSSTVNDSSGPMEIDDEDEHDEDQDNEGQTTWVGGDGHAVSGLCSAIDDLLAAGPV